MSVKFTLSLQQHFSARFLVTKGIQLITTEFRYGGFLSLLKSIESIVFLF